MGYDVLTNLHIDNVYIESGIRRSLGMRPFAIQPILKACDITDKSPMNTHDNRPLRILCVVFSLLWMGLPQAGAIEDTPLHNAAPIYFYASQPGKKTLDQGSNGGNPFATALIELLARPSLTFGEFATGLMDRTVAESNGFQRPDMEAATIQDILRLCPLALAPKPSSERRIALVLVFSDYSQANLPSLPGAKGDMERIAKAFRDAGFDEVRTAADPNAAKLESTLQAFAARSKEADLAVLYTTGHGIEVEGAIYLIPSNYAFLRNNTLLDKRTVPLSMLGSALQARLANLVFYGGCRDNPFAK